MDGARSGCGNGSGLDNDGNRRLERGQPGHRSITRVPGGRLRRRPGDEHPAAGRERPGHRTDARVRADRHRRPRARTSCGSTRTCSTATRTSPTRSWATTTTTSRSACSPVRSPRTETPDDRASRSSATSTTSRTSTATPTQTLAFGAGYAQAEDRLFLMDVLRHYGEGTLARSSARRARSSRWTTTSCCCALHRGPGERAGRRVTEGVRRAGHTREVDDRRLRRGGERLRREATLDPRAAAGRLRRGGRCRPAAERGRRRTSSRSPD